MLPFESAHRRGGGKAALAFRDRARILQLAQRRETYKRKGMGARVTWHGRVNVRAGGAKMSELDEYTSITDPTVDDVAALGDLSQLLSLWLERRQAGRLPARASFDPLEMRKLLGRIVILDVLSDPLRFRFRLVGTDWVTRFGFDPTNTFVDDFPRVPSRAFIKDIMSKVALERVPLMVRRSVIIDSQYFRYGMLLLPLATDGDVVDMIMMGFDFPNR
jgi:hypothetical protein